MKFLDQEWPLGNFSERGVTIKQIVKWVRLQPVGPVFSEIRKAFEAVRPHVPLEFVQNFCRMLSPEQLCELGSSPLVEVGGHTHSHPYLTSLEDEELAAEIDRPTERLASLLGRRIRMFAYPIGWYGPRELQRMAELKFDCAFAVTPRLGQSAKYEIPRTGIWSPSTSVARAKALGLVSMLRGISAKTPQMD